MSGEVTQVLRVLKILVQNAAVSSLKNTVAEISGNWTKATDSFFFFLSFWNPFLVILGMETIWSFSPPPPPSLLLSLLFPFSPLSLLPSPPASSLSKPAPDLVPSWLACVQLDSGRLPVAGRHRRRTRPERGQEERGPQRGRRQHEGRRHGGL